MEISYRSATPGDETRLFQLHEDAHRKLVEAAYGPWVAEQQREFFRPLMDDHHVSVIESHGVVVGAVYVRERDSDVWLELIEVAPSWQGRGVGTAALEWVKGTAARSSQGILLQVHRINEDARRLYLREGFTEVDTTATHHILRSVPPA